MTPDRRHLRSRHDDLLETRRVVTGAPVWTHQRWLRHGAPRCPADGMMSKALFSASRSIISVAGCTSIEFDPVFANDLAPLGHLAIHEDPHLLGRTRDDLHAELALK